MSRNNPNKNFATYEADREAKRKAQSVGGGEQQHTPGPWRVRAVRGATGASKNVWVQQEQIGAVARIYAGVRVLERPTPTIDEVNAIKDANARLIAAAPELLEACRDALSVLMGLEATGVPVGGTGGEDTYIGSKLRAAIAKAEGRAS